MRSFTAKACLLAFTCAIAAASTVGCSSSPTDGVADKANENVGDVGLSLLLAPRRQRRRGQLHRPQQRRQRRRDRRYPGLGPRRHRVGARRWPARGQRLHDRDDRHVDDGAAR